MIIRLKCFDGSLNTEVILALSHEFFSAKCAQFPFKFTEQN